MKILYEPALAEEKNELHWGIDSVQITYPLVNTCLTITYVYPTHLVGAHFGLLYGDTYTPADQIRTTLQSMFGVAPAQAVPVAALLIGNVDWWDATSDETFENLNIIKQHIRDNMHLEPDEAPNIEHETKDYSGGTVNIDIFHHGLVMVRSEDGKDFSSLNFRGGGGLSSAARGRLGL